MGKAVGHRLAERREVGRDVHEPLRAADVVAESGQDLVEHQDDAVARADVAQERQERRLRLQHADARAMQHGLDDHARVLVAVRRKELRDRLFVVVLQDGDMARRFRREPERFGDGHRCVVRSCRGQVGGYAEQDAVVPAVVRALELEDLGALRVEPRRAHRVAQGVGTAAAERAHLGRRNHFADSFGELHLPLMRRAEEHAALVERGRDGTVDFGMGVAEHARARAIPIVDVFVAVHVPQPRALRAIDEQRIGRVILAFALRTHRRMLAGLLPHCLRPAGGIGRRVGRLRGLRRAGMRLRHVVLHSLRPHCKWYRRA